MNGLCEYVKANGRKVTDPTVKQISYIWRSLGGRMEAQASKKGHKPRSTLEQYYLVNFCCDKYNTINLGVIYIPYNSPSKLRAELMLSDIGLVKRASYR